MRTWGLFQSHFNNFSIFYTPVWKTVSNRLQTVSNRHIMPWQCPSICLSIHSSVRPRFPDFSSTCFEISIWNLVYTFSRWHNMSSLSCIIIGSLWPRLQPKVGQTHFLQSWPHKSKKMNSSNLVHRWTAVYFSTKVRFFVIILFSEFWQLFLCVLDFSKFSGLFFLHVLRYQFETWYIHAVCGVTRQVQVSFQSGHFDLLYRGLRFGTHTYIVSELIPTDFCHGWAIFGPLVDKNTWKGMSLELPVSEEFSGFFLYMFWDISLKLGIYI